MAVVVAADGEFINSERAGVSHRETTYKLTVTTDRLQSAGSAYSPSFSSEHRILLFQELLHDVALPISCCEPRGEIEVIH